MILFAMIVSWMIIRAWEEGKAQAAAEIRRGREHAAGQLRQRMAAGEAASAGSSLWWWAAAARRAWRSMRGARKGSSPLALPAKSPLRRVAAAAWHGAKSGARAGAQQARKRRHSRRDEHQEPGSTGREKMRTRLGVCDNCGAVCARDALEPRQVLAGDWLEAWLLCFLCRTSGPRSSATVVTPDDAGPEPPARPAIVPGSEPALTAAAGPGAPIAAETGDGQDPAGVLAGAEVMPAISAGTITEGEPMSTELAVPAGNMPAVRNGDVTTYGGQQTGHMSDAQLLDALAYWLAEIRGDLTASNAGRKQIANVQAWASRIETEAALQREVSQEVDRHLGPVASTVDAVGGPEEVANTSYYEGIGA